MLLTVSSTLNGFFSTRWVAGLAAVADLDGPDQVGLDPRDPLYRPRPPQVQPGFEVRGDQSSEALCHADLVRSDDRECRHQPQRACRAGRVAGDSPAVPA